VDWREHGSASDRHLRSSTEHPEFVDGAEVMVVVLGDEETEVDDGHGLAQARVQRGARKLGGAHPREPFDDSGADGAEVSEDVGNRAVVMGGRVRFAVLKIGGMKLSGAGVIIIEALVPQRFKIEEMSGIFLDRPLAFMLSR
jgi:hypothetical protein